MPPSVISPAAQQHRRLAPTVGLGPGHGTHDPLSTAIHGCRSPGRLLGRSPALPTEELKAITGSWPTRLQEFELFTCDEEMKKLVAERKIILLGYRPLRDLQRKERKEG